MEFDPNTGKRARLHRRGQGDRDPRAGEVRRRLRGRLAGGRARHRLRQGGGRHRRRRRARRALLPRHLRHHRPARLPLLAVAPALGARPRLRGRWPSSGSSASITLLGFGMDPMSILVPFLVFAIAVSHGVQMVSSIGVRDLRRRRQPDGGAHQLPPPARAGRDRARHRHDRVLHHPVHPDPGDPGDRHRREHRRGGDHPDEPRAAAGAALLLPVRRALPREAAPPRPAHGALLAAVRGSHRAAGRRRSSWAWPCSWPSSASGRGGRCRWATSTAACRNCAPIRATTPTPRSSRRSSRSASTS